MDKNTCSHCQKSARGEMVYHIPPLLDITMGIDSEKAYHMRCYKIVNPQQHAELVRNKIRN